tara:strand:+ start:131 stop:1285 length:1155 start_codon:yes stop_codon:yes gene_type:complete
MKKITFCCFIIFLLFSNHLEAKIKVTFGGFSFGSLIPENTYTYNIHKGKGEQSIIDRIILEKTKNINNESFDIYFDALSDDLSEEDQNVMLLTLDNEYINHISIPEDNLTRTDIVLNFQIIFFNAKKNILIAAIPLEINKIISSSSPLSKKEIIKELSNVYQNEVMNYYSQLLKDFKLKLKYKNRIGVTKVIFEENAKNYINNNFDQKDIFIKTRFAKSFSSFLAFNNNLAIVPFGQDRTSRTIMLTYENTQREIKLPNPDYHVHLTIRGFKSVLFKESTINSQWIYGSFVNIKILQPEFPDEDKKVKIDERFKHGKNVEFSNRSIKNKESFEWIFFNESLKLLFDNFSMQTVKIDKKWLKGSNDNKKISKKFKNLKNVYESCK